MFLNNIAQLVSALGGGGSPAVYVSVFSVSSCVGRLLLGCHSSSSNVCYPQILPSELVQVAILIIVCAVCALLLLVRMSVLSGHRGSADWHASSARAHLLSCSGYSAGTGQKRCSIGWACRAPCSWSSPACCRPLWRWHAPLRPCLHSCPPRSLRASHLARTGASSLR